MTNIWNYNFQRNDCKLIGIVCDDIQEFVGLEPDEQNTLLCKVIPLLINSNGRKLSNSTVLKLVNFLEGRMNE